MSEMDREEAIEKLEMLNDALNWQRADADDCSEALQISIKALEKLQKIEQIFATCERTVNDTVFNPKLVCLAIERIVRDEYWIAR